MNPFARLRPSATFELLWVLALGALITLPGLPPFLSASPWVLLALGAVWPMRWFSSGFHRPQAQSPLSLCLFSFTLFLCLALAVATWISPAPAEIWVMAGYPLFGAALCRAITRWADAPARLRIAVHLLNLATPLLIVLALPNTQWKSQFRLFDLPLYAALERFQSPLNEQIHANVLAGALVMLLPFHLASALVAGAANGRRRTALLQWGLAALCLTVIGLTQSRGGYLAAAAAILVVMMLGTRSRRIGMTLLLAIGSTGVLALIAYSGLPNLAHLSGDGTLGGWSGRMEIWQQTWRAIHDFPFTGAGIGSFTTTIPLLYPLKSDISGYPHAHNLFLQIAFDLGLPGLIAYLSLLFNVTIMAVGLLQSDGASPVSSPRFLAIGALGALTALCVHGLLDSVMWGTRLAIVPWFFFGVVAAAYLQHTAGRNV